MSKHTRYLALFLIPCLLDFSRAHGNFHRSPAAARFQTEALGASSLWELHDLLHAAAAVKQQTARRLQEIPTPISLGGAILMGAAIAWKSPAAGLSFLSTVVFSVVHAGLRLPRDIPNVLAQRIYALCPAGEVLVRYDVDSAGIVTSGLLGWRTSESPLIQQAELHDEELAELNRYAQDLANNTRVLSFKQGSSIADIQNTFRRQLNPVPYWLHAIWESPHPASLLRALIFSENITVMRGEYPHLELPSQLSLRHLAEIGTRLTKKVRSKKYRSHGTHPFDVAIYLALDNTNPWLAHMASLKRAVAFFGSRLSEQLQGTWMHALLLLTHVGWAGFHSATERDAWAHDHELLVTTTRRLIALLYAAEHDAASRAWLTQTPQFRSRYRGKKPLATNEDVMLWMLDAAIDPTLYDSAIHTSIADEIRRADWFQNRRQSIPYFLRRICTDIDVLDSIGQPTGKKVPQDWIKEKLAQLMARTPEHWLRLGLRPPESWAGFAIDLSGQFSRIDPDQAVWADGPLNFILDRDQFPWLPTHAVRKDHAQFLELRFPSAFDFYRSFKSMQEFVEEVYFKWMKDDLPGLEGRVLALRLAA